MILSAQAVTKRYGAAPGYEAVRDANLELHEGEFVAIVGRSGSGKSTLLALLGALTKPTEGKLLLDGLDIWAMAETERASFRCRDVGFIFQFPSLLSNLSATDNVALPALLGGTLDPPAAYARARHLLARLGLADRAEAYPDSMSGGEQRRAVIARALMNSPRVLLADEPTSDLDEDTENDIIDLLAQLQRTESFGLALVTHNLEFARRARRTYEMRHGALTSADLPDIVVTGERQPRRFGPAEIMVDPGSTPSTLAGAPVHLGGNFLRGMQTFLLAGIIIFAGIMLIDAGIGRYQRIQMRERGARIAALQHMALNSLRGDIQSITDLGDGNYELTTYLENVGDRQIYVLSPDLRAYVQVGTAWQELPMKPADESTGSVLKIESRQGFRYTFEAQVREFAQLLPNYMHVRFSGTMLVSPSSMPKDDVIERKDNYYVYLKPSGVADEVLLKRMRFSGKPPVWIPMPPH
ncbi:MAG: ABC transporter ATP-binding protein [Xanthobacteraceae bacterium]